MKFISTVIVAILSVAAMAAPAPAPEAAQNLEKRGCSAGTICSGHKCYPWNCGPTGCSAGFTPIAGKTC
ncbi:hypothetical protein TWF694_002186 [Orbilia ellipsospora]|uniref:Uncharacterized protein n=1 Tax=Orbilia ellipsospora TaxID=2528407 RepID=A0AAV9X663_9PEZI